MATIYKISQEMPDSSSYGEMNEMVENYWESSDNEKVFSIPFWKLNQLFIAATDGEIAFKVKDMDKPAWVNGEWMVFSEGMEELFADPNQEGIYYFVIDEDVFNGIRDAVLEDDYSLHEVAIGGRLGKVTPEGSEYVAFIVAYECLIIPPGGGGGGAASGIRIPPAL